MRLSQQRDDRKGKTVTIHYNPLTLCGIDNNRYRKYKRAHLRGGTRRVAFRVKTEYLEAYKQLIAMGGWSRALDRSTDGAGGVSGGEGEGRAAVE